MKKLLLNLGLMVWSMAGSQAQESTLFSLLPPSDTDITFTNTVTDEKDRNILIYNNYYNGGGVGLGDLNQDGLLDIYFTGNLVGDQLYLNRGAFRFEEITQKAGIHDDGSWSSGVTLIDINADGLLDIYVSKDLYDHNPAIRKNKLYIHQGNTPEGIPVFKEMAEEYGLADDHRTRHATFFDYDKDGDLDVYVLNQPPNLGNYSPLFGTDTKDPKYTARLYQNNYDKKLKHPVFTDVTRQAGMYKPGYALGVCVSDFNNDQWPDLYLSNDYDAPDFLYLNNQNGTFTNVIDTAMKHISNFSMGNVSGDINRDGWMDIFVLDMAAEDNRRIKTNMSGMNPESFWKVQQSGGHYQYMFNTLQLNNGNGRFSEIAQLAGLSSTDWSWCPLLADFDNDGYPDLFVTNGLKRDIRDNDANKKFPGYVDSVARTFVARHPNAGEVNFFDIVNMEEMLELLPSEKLPNYMFRNNGDLTFTKVIREWGFNHPSFSNGAAFGDLDNDGDLDIVVNNVDDVAHVYKNNLRALYPQQHFLRIKFKYPADDISYIGSQVSITTERGSQVQYLANIHGFYSTSEPIAHFGLGRIHQVQQVTVRWPDGKTQTLYDLNADQILTLDYRLAKKTKTQINSPSPPLFKDLTQQSAVDFRHRENSYNDFAREVLLPHKMSNFGPCLAVADVNHDGLEDFYIGGAMGQSGVLYLQSSRKGSFHESKNAPWQEDQDCEDLGAVFFDADQDGDMDLYVVSGGNEYEAGDKHYQDRLYINQGNGTFQKEKHALPTIKASGSRVVPADFDQDGDLDLFIGGRQVPGHYPAPARSYLLRNDGGKFKDISQQYFKNLKKLGMVTDATWTDFNQDGLQDLIVVGEWMPVTFLQNTGSEFADQTEAMGFAKETGWWFRIAVADMDQDGDQDIIAGNLGLNYKYKATYDEPFTVHYNDFDHNGSMDIVLGYYNFGELYPVRGRQCSSEQVPLLKKKFPDYQSFATSNLVEVYGLQNINQALNYKVHNFANMYYENLGNGQYKGHPLPNLAQISSVNALLIEDFNQDKHLDLLIAGNLYASEVETPRNDAGIGLLLLGNGKGRFQEVPATQSGFCTKGDVKDMVLLQNTQEQWVLVANNNDLIQIIRVQAKNKRSDP
ncbi:VCBS repeat-containing protein [Rapidithrix thailandica]|uniref:VCBS repeat-containing protein n=1 Tax=Rapidithrix thailandica TaxID=413964 RepID=A0AAW9RUS2_9BACT